MSSYISKIWNTASNTVLHPLATAQRATETCLSCVRKTKEVVEATFRGKKIEVYGYDLNPVTRLHSWTAPALRKAHILSPEEIITDEAIRDQMTLIRQTIDLRFQNIQTPLSENTSLEPQELNQNPIDNRQSIEDLKRAEKEAKRKLVNHILNFSSISWFDSKIYGASRQDSMEFYRNLVSESNGEPLKKYYDNLWKESALYYSLASILIPISSWIIELFINPPEGVNGGITHATQTLNNYFRNPENSRLEVVELIKNAKTYFYKLFSMYESFVAVKKDPFHIDHSLTLEQYLDKKLREDLTSTDTTKEKLCDNFNKVLVDLFTPKSAIPVVGGLIDSVLKTTLSYAIHSIDPINKLLSSSFSQTHSNTTFTYKVTSLIKEQVDALHEQLIQSQQEQSANPSLQLSASNKTSLEDNVSEQEKRMVTDFIENLLKFLPLEGTLESEVENSLNPLSPSIFKPKQKIEASAKSAIQETLKSFGVKLFGMFLSSSTSREQRLKIWNDVFNISNGFFSQPAVPRTTNDCILIKQETKNSFKGLLNSALEFHFQNSMVDLNKIHSNTILEKLQSDIDHFNLVMEQLKDQLNVAIDEKNFLLLSDLKNEMLVEIKNFFTRCQLILEETISNPDLGAYTQKAVKKTLSELSKNIQDLLQMHAGIDEALTHINLNAPLLKTTLSLSTQSENTQDDTQTILPQKTFKELCDKISQLIEKEQLITERQEKFRDSLLRVSESKTLDIFTLNQALISKEKIFKLLDESKKIALENEVLQDNISRRPKGQGIDYFKELLVCLSEETIKIRLSQEVSTEDLEYLNSLFLELRTGMQDYPFDEESLLQLQCFLETPNTTTIKENFRLVSVAIKNLQMKLDRSPSEDQKALEKIRRNKRILQGLQNQVLEQNTRFAFLEPHNTDVIGDMTTTPLSAVIKKFIDENLVETILIKNQKASDQEILSKTFQEMHRQKEEHLDKRWLQARQICQTIEERLEELVEAKENLKPQEVMLSIFPGREKVNEFQKSQAKPIFESITNKLLDVILEPRHRRELLFRTALATEGSFARIMRDAQ
jgi:hypothetical protein